MANTQIKAVRDAVALVLSDAGHTVYKYGADPAHAGRTWTWIAAVRSEQERLTMGNNRSESLTVDLVTVHLEGGRSDTAAATGETTVLDVVAAIENDVRVDATLGGVVFHAEPSTSLEVTVAASDDGWMFEVTHSIEVEAHI